MVKRASSYRGLRMLARAAPPATWPAPQAGFRSTAMMLPAGSVNQAMSGP